MFKGIISNENLLNVTSTELWHILKHLKHDRLGIIIITISGVNLS